MNRRNFLKACSKFGLSYASFPLLGALPSLAHAVDLEVTQGKRFLTVYNPNGMHQPSWSTGDGHRQDDEWEFSNLLSPLQPLKEKTIVVEGVSRWGNEDGARHQQGMVGLLTGRELGDEGFSIDQLLADHWNTQSLLLGVQNIPGLYNTSTGYSNFRVSFRGRREAGAQVANNNPFSVFQQTFAGLTPTNPYENFATNRSVLDGLLDEVNSVKRRLSADDIHLLDAHQQGIRDIECRLHGLYCSDEVNEPTTLTTACQPPALIAQPNNLDDWLIQQENFPTIARLQSDIAVSAISCSIAPVIVLQYAGTESSHTYSWVNNENGDPATSAHHHDLSHNVYNSDIAARDFSAIHKWYASQVAYIGQQLDAIPEGDGSVLDNTLIYWGTCLGTPQIHHQANWPSVLIGNLDGFFRTNQSLDFRANTDSNGGFNGRCYTDPNRCIWEERSDTSQCDLLNTMAAALGMGATNDTAVVGNLEGTNDESYVGNAYHGLIDRMMS